MFEYDGIAQRSRHQQDPPLHILVEGGGYSWATWCTGAPALKTNNVSRRRCPKCWTLLLEAKREAEEEGDEFEHDWFTSTRRSTFNLGSDSLLEGR